MFTDSPFLLTLQLTTNFSELIGRLSTDLGDDEVRDDAVWQVVDSLQRWWEATRPTPDLRSPLSLKLPEAGTLPEAASMLVNPFGAFLAESLAGPLSPSNAARLTIAAHIGGFTIHLWRHWENIYEIRCVAELSAHVPSELLACAIGHLERVPASALRGYIPEEPEFSQKYRNPVRIGWDTGHHVAFLCAERGWFGDAGGRPMSSLENGATDEAHLNAAPAHLEHGGERVMSIDVMAFNPTDERFHDRHYPGGVWDDLIEVSTSVAGKIVEHAPYDPESQMNGEVEPEETNRVGQLLLQAIEAAGPNDDWRLRSPDVRDWAEFLVACRGFRWF